MSGKNVTLGEIIFDKRNLYFLYSDCTVEVACNYLSNLDIISVPVYDSKQRKWIGMVDIFELMRFVVFEKYWAGIVPLQPLDQFSFSNERLDDLIASSERARKIIVFDALTNLVDTMKILGNKDSTQHRALVVQPDDATRKPTYRLVSQMDICRFLNRYADYSKPVFEKRIEELGLANPLGSNSLFTISNKDSALQGFQKLAIKNLLAAPIVDEKGIIVGNLSASDMRGINKEKLDWVNLPVLSFLDRMNASRGRKHPMPITCSSRSSLKEIIPSLLAARVHRVWVVDAARVPIGVVTLTDIIHAIITP